MIFKTILVVVTLFSLKCGLINTTKNPTINNDLNGLIAAFGDFDSDKLTDVFLITNRGKTLELLKGFANEPVLRKWPSIKCTFERTSETIVSVIPSDFHGSAMMDVLVVTQTQMESSLSRFSHEFKLWLFKGTITALECNTSAPLVEHVSSHPLLLDYNADMITDFIVETSNCSRQLWTKSSTGFQAECLKELQPNIPQKMAFPNSNAFINLDNCTDNMSPDIFIKGENKMEMWYDVEGFSSKNVKLISLPEPKLYGFVGQSSFIDINIDGIIDHIVPVCKTNIRDCREPTILAYDRKAWDWVVVSDLSYGPNSSLTFVELTSNDVNHDNVDNIYIPVTLRHGDIDGDGYIDLITVMRNSDNVRKAMVLKNVRDDTNAFKRKFVLDPISDSIVPENSNVDMAAFFDLFEDGKLDILMSVNDGKDISLKAVLNTEMIAACFLKVLVTSGLCYGSSCPRGNIPYGTNQIGPQICYELADTNGKMQTGCAGQLSQSSHFALQLPYSVFGLGETPNFVETVSASIPSVGMKQLRKSKWTQIVPDAQVVLIPYPPNETYYWICKLFVTPSNIVFSTLITLASICCVLVLIIAILHRKELLEDLAEHEEYKRHWPESR